MVIPDLLTHVESTVLWGLAATVALTTVLMGSQGLGLSRLSLPYLVGTFFSGSRSAAYVVGSTVYLLGGWIFAFGYSWVFLFLEQGSWWLGGALGLVHGLFLLVVVLPMLPHLHPRMATEYDGPTALQRLEPPGFMGLHYGRRTPLTTLFGHLLYGVILGATAPV